MAVAAGLSRKWSRARRIVRHRTVPHALILMYHRVTALDADPHLLAVTPEHFASHLEILRRRASLLSLEALTGRLDAGAISRRSVVVTFDDGYADNLHEAMPLLERFDVPATMFVTAGYVGSDREFWWDELERIVLRAGSLPAELRLDVDGRERRWELGDPAADPAADGDWNIEREDRPTARHRVFMDLFGLLAPLPDDGKQDLLARLRAWAGLGPTGRASHRALDAEQLCRLADSELIEIGAHSMTHPFLGHLTPQEQRAEVEGSRRRLEAIVGRPVTSFALPHGSRDDRTTGILSDAGFARACTSQPAPVWRHEDVLGLPRIGVRDLDGETFARWFSWWMDG
jgi:peptidoglycan/xylan/chitin deacetylase (PgdA/CDA1 family)